MNIKIIGSGCKKCETLSESVKKVASENNIDCTIEKISDIEKIIEMGIMTTPVLMIDDLKVAVGKVPSEAEILQYLKKDNAPCACSSQNTQSSCACNAKEISNTAKPTESTCSCTCGCGSNATKKNTGKKLVVFALLAFVFISLAVTIFRESSTPSENTQSAEQEISNDALVVYYFHGTKRCFSCNNIENFTKKTLEEKFKAKLDNGSIILKSINIEEPENEHFIKDFAMTSRYVVLQKGEKFERLEKVWEYAKDESAMISYIENSINNFLK